MVIVFLNQLLNAVFQIVLFSLIPLIWWLITAMKKENFFRWLGMKRAECASQKNLWILTGIVLVVCFLVGEFAIWLRGDLAAALPSVLAYSYLQTGLSEEILFRGFLLKRMAAKFGFTAANVIQALIFGALHLTMVWGRAGLAAGIVITIYPMLPAVAFAYLNEKKAGGSILPSWIIHGTINTFSALVTLF